jgi:hypothetical protein
MKSSHSKQTKQNQSPMFGFGPCTLKKHLKNCKFLSVFAMQVAITSFSKVSIQVNPKFNGPVTILAMISCA